MVKIVCALIGVAAYVAAYSTADINHRVSIGFLTVGGCMTLIVASL